MGAPCWSDSMDITFKQYDAERELLNQSYHTKLVRIYRNETIQLMLVLVWALVFSLETLLQTFLNTSIITEVKKIYNLLKKHKDITAIVYGSLLGVSLLAPFACVLIASRDENEVARNGWLSAVHRVERAQL